MSEDSLQARLTRYACELEYGALPEPTVQAAKARIIDTLAAALGGFSDEPCKIARERDQLGDAVDEVPRALAAELIPRIERCSRADDRGPR